MPNEPIRALDFTTEERVAPYAHPYAWTAWIVVGAERCHHGTVEHRATSWPERQQPHDMIIRGDKRVGAKHEIHSHSDRPPRNQAMRAYLRARSRSVPTPGRNLLSQGSYGIGRIKLGLPLPED